MFVITGAWNEAQPPKNANGDPLAECWVAPNTCPDGTMTNMMWLRDTMNQMRPYLAPLLASSENDFAVAQTLRGMLQTVGRSISINASANAVRQVPDFSSDKAVHDQFGWTAFHQWEADSIAWLPLLANLIYGAVYASKGAGNAFPGFTDMTVLEIILQRISMATKRWEFSTRPTQAPGLPRC